jgi:hypothetical protein
MHAGLFCQAHTLGLNFSGSGMLGLLGPHSWSFAFIFILFFHFKIILIWN